MMTTVATWGRFFKRAARRFLVKKHFIPSSHRLSNTIADREKLKHFGFGEKMGIGGNFFDFFDRNCRSSQHWYLGICNEWNLNVITVLGSYHTWDCKMASIFFIYMAANWLLISLIFSAKKQFTFFGNQFYTALGFQKYSHCPEVKYISHWTIPFYLSVVSLVTKKSSIFAKSYKCESEFLL